MPRITVKHETGQWHHQLGSETVTIGRDEGCDIRFNDRSVAGVQCRIVPRDDDWIIENADTDHFTLLNGKVADLEPLHSGDRITVGNFALIFDADPDVIVADFEAGGLQFLFTECLPPGKHRVVFFAPRSESGCAACYEALVHGAQGIMCRPASAEEFTDCDKLLQSVRDGIPMRPEDCPAVKRLQDEEGA